MKTYVVAVLVLFTISVGVFAQGTPASGGAAPHVAAAKQAAGQDHLALFNNICSPPPREKWYAPPVKVFDNLYYVGMTEYSAWAVTTSDGIIVIDPLFHYSVEEEVVNGLTKLGLDPKRIRYVVVSHAHQDHVAGAAFLQDRGARVVMSAADWDWLANDPGRWPKARRDMVAFEGQKLLLGDTVLTIHLTPGHTPGTISTVIPLRDGANRHTAILWGGTGFNWRSGSPRYITPDRPPKFWYDNYANSARKMRGIAKQVGADVVLSNHPQYDQSTTKLALMSKRAPGQPHPYVIGWNSVDRFLTVAEECAKAGPLW